MADSVGNRCQPERSDIAVVQSPQSSSSASLGKYSLNRMRFFSEKHPLSVLENMYNMRKQRELCDVVILVGTKRIYAHRVVLGACSPYFRAMFTTEMAESRQTEVTIKDVDENALEMLIDFCYTSSIVIEESNVQQLLPAACLMQMQEIQDVCCDFLKKQLDPTNCLGIRAFADTHSCRDLLRIANRFTQHNFQEVLMLFHKLVKVFICFHFKVMETEEFMLLPVEQLCEIISSDELNVRSEEQVFKACMAWVRHKIFERRKDLPEVTF
ncbi:BTB/POZ domain protein [Trichuris suis]|nr:BTB/POZ domain protein [Trichuris suis]